jgi:FtsZ-interacting cell division protein ZipA
MSVRNIAIGVGCVLIAVQGYAEGSSTNLLDKSQLRLLDANRNGMLEYKELANLPKVQSEAALDAYDINSDGEISSTEFERTPRTKESMEQEAKQKALEKKQASKKDQPPKQVQKKKEEPKQAPKKEEVKQAPKKKPDPKDPKKKPAPKPDPKKKDQK